MRRKTCRLSSFVPAIPWLFPVYLPTRPSEENPLEARSLGEEHGERKRGFTNPCPASDQRVIGDSVSGPARRAHVIEPGLGATGV